MSDYDDDAVATAEVGPPAPFAAPGEASVASNNMTNGATAVPRTKGEPVDYAELAEKIAERMVGSDLPPMMDDADALIVGREIEARYVPPPVPPTVLEQLNAMKAGAPKEPPANVTPPPQPADPMAS